jgi:phage terminase small subunit
MHQRFGMAQNKLTAKQEAFCLAFIRLNDQSAAYREAYDCSKMKSKTVHERASRLTKECKLSTRIDELRKAIENSSIMTAKQLQEWWTETIKGDHVDADYKDKLKASELLGKAIGVFIDKVQLTGKDGGPIETKKPDFTDEAGAAAFYASFMRQK